ncbi:MAG: ATP-binding cassette domain-containing protein, partial [Gammaproteobacteria bacterium]|nr:ATP-binding cassette domain-containing protein [Gammaproteobacteria bacterium]
MKKASPVLQAQGLCFRWPERFLFEDLSFDVPPGVSLISGEEHSGKTSLLQLLAGDTHPQSGTLVIRGNSLHEDRERYRQQVFRTDPRSESIDQISAATWFQSLPGRYPNFDPEALVDLIQGFALDPHIEKPMYMLSAGSKRKVLLTAAFASGTPLTLIDQPFAALDTPSMRFLSALLQEAAEHPGRAWVLADYEAPVDVVLASVIGL